MGVGWGRDYNYFVIVMRLLCMESGTHVQMYKGNNSHNFHKEIHYDVIMISYLPSSIKPLLFISQQVIQLP